MDGPPGSGTAIELVTIGTELLLGFTVDTNSAFLAAALAAAGMPVLRRTAVSDDPAQIRDAVDAALERAAVVITTGGLGPTSDDRSRETVAQLLGLPLQFDDDVWHRLEARFAKLGRVPVASNRTQAMVPEGAEVLVNQWGTAPGLWIETARGIVIMLPGVPYEMQMLTEHEVVPRLAARFGGTVVRSATLRTTGVAESTLAEAVAPVEAQLAPLTLAYLPGLRGVDLRLTAWQMAPATADAALKSGMGRLCHAAERWVYGEGDTDLAAVVLDALRTSGLKLAVAESCTGGMLGARLTDIPGASQVFVGGAICYADPLKTDLLGVNADTIAAHGAVSEETVREMAAGAARRLHADVTIAITGIAGPDGGTADKPVGTVWFGYSVRGQVDAVRRSFVGTRHDIRSRACQAALMDVWGRVRS